MEDVERLKEAYRKILAMYKEAGIIKEVKFGYELNPDNSMKRFDLFVVPQNIDLLEELFSEDNLSVSYAESLENALYSFLGILDIKFIFTVFIMVYGSGDTSFDPNDLKILEV